MSVYILIPFLPLAASLILALGGKRIGAASHKVAIPAIGLSFALSVGALIEVVNNGPLSVSLYRFMQSGNLVIDLGLYIDQLTVLLLPLVTGVSGIVYVYSARYMIGDPRYNRFFAVTTLFTFAMIMLVMSSNLLLLYIVWEIMGLCSYLLISHWAERPSACQAATKTFLMNAVADVGLGFAIILTFATFGTLDIQEILSRAGEISGQTVNLLGWAGVDWPVQTVTLITLFLLMGAAGKSAQIPFHVWLPFAMEAPTPVSALMYAATMVNAGPFLLVRLSPLLLLSPTAMTVTAILGGATALFAAVVSLTQTDIKKILAYSTISQFGFMIMACGVGAFVAAIFHMLAHGWLKGFLFLSTGNVLQSVQTHGLAAARVRPTAGSGAHVRGALLLGSLTLACIPPFVIFSGSYEQLWTVQHVASAPVVFRTVGLITVFVTAMYIFRGVTAFFQHGPVVERSGSADPVHLRPQLFSPFHLLVVVLGVVVASGALAVLWVWFANFLAPVLGPAGTGFAASAVTDAFSLWMIVSLGVAVVGWGTAYALHVNPGRFMPGQSEWGKRLYVLFLNKGYVDELYAAYVVQPTLRCAVWFWKTIDLGCIDRAVIGVAGVSVALSRWLWQVVDVRGIDRMVTGTDRHTMNVARWFWQHIEMRKRDGHGERVPHRADNADWVAQDVKPRMLQHHILVMVFWLIIAIGLFYWSVP